MTIKFGRLTSGLGGEYCPVTNIIMIDITTMQGFAAWKRQTIALLMHEFIHWADWHFLYRHDVEKWNKSENETEHRANKIQTIVLKVLFADV